jgi:hypothetical protein
MAKKDAGESFVTHLECAVSGECYPADNGARTPSASAR